MSRAEFYRAEANRCHLVALSCRDPEETRRWREVAQGNQDIAEQFERLNKSVRGTVSSWRDVPTAPSSQRGP
jgi:hypothetical protein